MASIYMLLLSALVLSCEVSCGQVFDGDLNEESEDSSDWYDPTDMINYDLASGRMRNTRHSQRQGKGRDGSSSECVCKDDFTEEYRRCESTVGELQSEVASLNSSVTKLTQQVSRCSALQQEVFFHQYVRSLLQQLPGLATPKCDTDYYQVEVHMTSSQYKYLKDYVDQRQDSTAEVHSILSSMMTNLRWESCLEILDESSSLWQQSKEWLWIITQAMGLMCCSMWLFINVRWSLRRILVWLVTSSFVVSIPWTWWHLYKKEVAKHHAEMLTTMPDSCWSDRKSFWSFMTSWLWAGNAECVKHFEAMEIDPFWEVPPTKAVAVTFVRFFLEPAGHIGEALNRLVTEAYRDLPFYLWLQVFALIVLLLVVSMFFMSGYRVRGWLWNIEPHRPVEPLRQRIQELEQERQSLHEERRHLQRQLKDEQREHREQTVRLGELQRQNMLLYNDRPGLRGEGDAPAVQLLLQHQSTATPGDVVSLHSDQSADGEPVRDSVPVEETGGLSAATARETELEEDYEFVSS